MQGLSDLNIGSRHSAAEMVTPLSGKTTIWRRLKSPIVLVFLGSIFMTTCFWAVLPDRYRVNEQSDYFALYEPVARNLIAGRGYTMSNGDFVTVYPPGYPLLLAGIFTTSRWLNISDQTSLSVFAVACMAFASVFIFLLSQLLWGTRPALLSSLAWMTYPFALWLTKQPNSELPFMVLFYGGLFLFWLALKRRLPAGVFLLTGFVFGAAMLIRPLAIGISLVLAATVWFFRTDLGKRTRCLIIVMLLLGNLVAVLPWESWAYLRTGKVIPLSTNGVKSMRDGLTFAVEEKGYRPSSNLPADVLQVMEEIRDRESSIFTGRQLAAVVADEIQRHPLATTKLWLLKLARAWYGTDSQRLELGIILFQLVFLSLIAWGGYNAWKHGGEQKRFVLGALLIVLYFWGMTFLGLSILRYLVPAIGVLLVLVGGCYPPRFRQPVRTAP